MMKYKKIEVDSHEIEQRLNTSTLVSKVLAFRKCTDDQINQLLTHQSTLTKNPSLALKEVCQRLLLAKENKEKVFVGGDYDADGICATSIMVDTLNLLEIENGYYIPNRFKEGYGLHPNIVQLAHDKGYQIIITVDNGVKAFEALKLAKELGIEVIILDHHEIEEKPECAYLLHPDLFEEPFKGLSGAGVTLQVANELVGRNHKHIALACVATMGDIMNLWGENRTIVRLGLDIINQHLVPHIDALLDTNSKVTEKDIAFQIVPKLNAVGRLQEMANPNNVVKFFLQNNPNEIKQFALQMNELNNQRKQMTLQMNVLAEKKNLDDDFIIVQDERFHEGLVGLLAGKLAGKYKKPSLVFCETDELIKGSGRTANGFDLYSFFAVGFEDEFVNFGGHSGAIGCSIKKEKFEQFKDKVKEKFAHIELQQEILEEACTISANELSLSAVHEYLDLAPFGQGFAEVIFAVDDLKVVSTQLIKQKFLKIKFENNIEAIWFDVDPSINVEECKTVYAEVTINEFLGRKKCSLIVKTIE